MRFWKIEARPMMHGDAACVHIAGCRARHNLHIMRAPMNAMYLITCEWRDREHKEHGQWEALLFVVHLASKNTRKAPKCLHMNEFLFCN